MANVTRVEASITAQNHLKPGLEAAAAELDRFHKKRGKANQAAAAEAAKAARVYGEITEKLSTMQKALGTIGRRKTFAAMSGQVEGVRKDLEKMYRIKTFQVARSGLEDLAVSLRQARREAAAAKAAAVGGSSPEAMFAQERATRAVEHATLAFRGQLTAARNARDALTEAGIAVKTLATAEASLKRNIEAATVAINKQAHAQMRRDARREGMSQIAGFAGVAAGYKGKQIAGRAVHSIGDFDIAVRKQRAFTDITEADQQRLLIPQAKRIGQDTQFSNLDIVKAQTTAMQGLPTTISGPIKAEVAQGIIENVKNYALVMEADMERSAEAIRSYLQTTNQDIGTKEKALAAANKATNQLVRMAKLGGMSDEDVQQYLKFAAASGSAAGLTPESLMSIAALARRGGLSGDEAGVFMRSTASKLVSPTKKGIAALNAAGIDHSQYVKMPGSLDVDLLEGQFKTQMGLGFAPDVRERLAKVLADPKALGDRGSFTEAVTNAVESQFPKTKKGTMRPADRVNVAKAAGAFYQTSASSVDTEGLLDKIMESSMTLAQLNALLTDKHGGKGAITQRQREEYVSARKQLRDTADDPNYAKKKADEIMGGVGGSLEQAKGAMENFILSIGTANEGLIRLGANSFSSVLESFDKLSTGSQQAATALGAIAALGGTAYGTAKLFGMLTGGGGAAALTGAGAALTEAAVALNVAAGRLGVAGAAGAGASVAGTTTAGAAGVAAAKTGVGGLLANVARIVPTVGAAALAGYGISVIGKANAEKYKNTAPGEQHNEGRNRRRAHNDKVRAGLNDLRSKTEAEDARAVEVPTLTSALADFPEVRGNIGGSDRSGDPGRIVGPGTFNLSGVSEVRAKVDQVKSGVEAIGPAAAHVGAALASEFEAGMERAKASVAAGVADMQRLLNSLQMPNLSVGRSGGGVSGLNVGRGMQEVR